MSDAEAVQTFKEKANLSDEDFEAMRALNMPSERALQDYRSTYNDIRDWQRQQRAAEQQQDSKLDWDDVVFEVDLLKSQEINLDYILEQIFEKNKQVNDKAALVDDIRRMIRASLGNRAKEGLMVDFINQTDLDSLNDKHAVMEAFFTYARAEQQREADALIETENLNVEAAKRYIAVSLKREYASDQGTELNAVLPQISPLNPQYLSKKLAVFEKLAEFVEKFRGI